MELILVQNEKQKNGGEMKMYKIQIKHHGNTAHKFHTCAHSRYDIYINITNHNNQNR